MPDTLISLSTSLAPAKLRFRSLSASEELGRPFEYSVAALSEDPAIDLKALIGTSATVKLEMPDASHRFFNGLVTQIGFEGSSGGRLQYRLVLRPWLWLLTRRADTRIFQKKTAEVVIKEVFEPYSSVQFKFDLTGTLPTYEYLVQYRETDFNFVSRLLEQEGLYYYFEHSDGQHKMVIVNQMSKHAAHPGHAQIIKFGDSSKASTDVDTITDWRTQFEMLPGKVTLNDYNFTEPDTPLKSESASQLAKAKPAYEHYDPPGDYLTKAAGDRYAALRMEEIDVRYARVFGAGNARSLATGYRFTLAGHPLAAHNGEHVVTSTRIDASYSGYESGQGDTHYGCSFVAIPATAVFRPQRLTPKPTVPGPQTALVVGTSGEEIDTDEYGRVKLHFYWDRLGKKNQDSSCWVRVSHPLAGKGFGLFALPRMGEEVVVDFLEGDPDRPLVTGRVHNANQVVPYTLPDHKTVSTFKTRSTKQGAAANFNELRFEDEKGKEYVWFQAEKDFRHLVKNNSHTLIKANEHRLVGGDRTEGIKGKNQVSIDGFEKRHVKGDRDIKVDGNGSLTTVGDYSLWTKDAIFECQATVMNFKTWDMVIQDASKLLSPKVEIKADKIVLEATQKISLKVGGNFVVIDPSGVSIKGVMVNINSGGSADSASEAADKDFSEPAAPDEAAEPEDPLTSRG